MCCCRLQSDLLVALGVRFDDRVTGKLETFAQRATIVHIDIDTAEIGKNKVRECVRVRVCAEEDHTALRNGVENKKAVREQGGLHLPLGHTTRKEY